MINYWLNSREIGFHYCCPVAVKLKVIEMICPHTRLLPSRSFSSKYFSFINVDFLFGHIVFCVSILSLESGVYIRPRNSDQTSKITEHPMLFITHKTSSKSPCPNKTLQWIISPTPSSWKS